MTNPEPLPCGWPAKRVAESLVVKVATQAMRLAAGYPSMRSGQVAFNALQDLAPDFADRIHGTDADPFYDDEKLDDFWAAVDAADTP